MKTQDLIGPALDYAVALCEGYHLGDLMSFLKDQLIGGKRWHNTRKADEIIDRELIATNPTIMSAGYEWAAEMCPREGDWTGAHGPTRRIAAMRCYVASKLGDEVDIPEELQP